MHTVYLVDDDKPVIDSYWTKRGLFMASGFEICGAETNSTAALEAIRALRPDVVISDMKMPGLSGIDLLKELRRDVLPPFFVIVSAYHEHKDIRKLFLTHGFDYLVKPVDDSDLTDLLNRLAGKIEYNLPEVERKTTSAKLNEILHYLKEYSSYNHTLESIGERFDVNPNYICNLFSKHLDTTFSAYLISLRMSRAEELLRTTDFTAKEIAVKSGYSNHFYFTRLFQKEHGMSPLEYRKAHHEK